MSNERIDSNQSRAKRRMKRYGLPAGLLAGGLALGSLVMPIGLANAQDAETADSTSTDSTIHERMEGRGHGRGPGGFRFGGGGGSEVVQELLGMTHEEIHAAIDGGQTLAQLAESEGVTQADLVAALVAEATERIDAAVAEGQIDETKATELKADLEARITERVTTMRERMERRGHLDDGESTTSTTEA